MHSRHLLVPLLFVISSSVGAQGPAPAGQRPPDARPATAAVQSPAAPPAGALPVRRVVLYKTGVGYFEHLGNVRNRQDVAIRFTSAQLNDVLKSLTTIDMGNGQVTGISYNSIAPMEQRLGALRIPIGPGATTVDLLAALRGARIEASGTAGTVVGPAAQRRAAEPLHRERRVGDRGRGLTGHRCRRRPQLHADALSPPPHRRPRSSARSLPISRRRRIGARAGRASDGDLDVRQRRAAAVRQLRQRGADLEDHVSAGVA